MMGTRQTTDEKGKQRRQAHEYIEEILYMW